MPETAKIYGLSDPNTQEIRYIGKANNPAERYKGHLRDASRRTTPVYHWINSLQDKPHLIVLASCLTSDWQSVEKQIIAQYREDHSLLNLADGGNQPKSNSAVNRINGYKLNERIKQDPSLNRIREVKKMMGDFIKRASLGKVRQEVKDRIFAKLRLAAEKNPVLFGEYRHL
jgi:hypothetical protein